MLEQTRASIASNRAILLLSRYRIAASRRRLNPAFAVSGGAAPPRRVAVRALLITGVLPPPSAEILAGPGSGRRCAICHEPVASAEVEYELYGGVSGAVVCHLPCYIVWREESERATGDSAAD